MTNHLADCACCGAPLDPVDLDVRMALPDPVLDVPEGQRAKRTRGNDVLMAVKDVGAFVRCLMPVRLTGGTVTFGLWLAVHPDDLRRAHTVWNAPEYRDLALDGNLANAVLPWGDAIAGAPVRATVRDVDEVPYLESSEHPEFARVLTDEWDRDFVLATLAFALPAAVRNQIAAGWSIERTAGLVVHRTTADELRFAGQGRTVQVEVFGSPTGADEDYLVTHLLPPASGAREGWLAEETDGGLRRAYWQQGGTELYGFVAREGSAVRVACVHDDPADLAWAQSVWRSVRHG